MAETRETALHDGWNDAEGGCICGAVRYRLKAKPLIVHCCHCTWCQRETGSAFAVNAVIEASQVEMLKSTPVATTLPSASGKGQVLWRCTDCGVTVWSNYPQAGPRFNFVRAGTLDNPAQAPPDIHIYTSTKQPWVALPDGVRAVAEFYNPAEVWPAESLRASRRTGGVIKGACEAVQESISGRRCAALPRL